MNKIIYFSIIILLFSCSSKNSSNEIKSNKIVIIYNTNLKDSVIAIYNKTPFDTLTAKYSPIVTYNSLQKETTSIIFNTNKDYKDTILIYSKTPITLKHNYNLDYYYFSLSPGDTITYSSKDGIPYYSNNKKTNLNIQYISKINRKKKYISDDIGYKIISAITENRDINNDFFYSTYLEYKKNISLESRILDSLSDNKFISKIEYNLHKDRITFDSINLILNKYFSFLFHESTLSKLKPYLKKDELIQHAFFQNFLLNYAAKKFKINNKTNNTSVFDSISNTPFTKKNKEYLLKTYLIKTLKEIPKNKFRKYLDQYLEVTKDTSSYYEIKNRYLITEDSYKKTDDIQITSFNKKTSTLKKHLLKSKKEIYFIDFWATWCFPCLKKTPEILSIEKRIKNKSKIGFIYLSIDSDYNAWKKHLTVNNLSTSNNFMINNYPNALFFKENQLNTIPRYMIINKYGKVINNDSPILPEEELESYLIKKNKL